MTDNPLTIDWPIVGNEHVTGFLTERIARDTADGVYLFAGPNDVGKHTAAVFFARLLLCQRTGRSGRLPCGQCPACRRFDIEEKSGAEDSQYSLASDFFTLRRQPDKKEIAVEDTREFIRNLSYSSFLNGHKVGIIHEAGALSEEAANALLKTLEEPKRKVTVILVADSPDRLLPTIVSRCQTLVFRLVAAGALYDQLLARGSSRSNARIISRLAFGRPALAAKLHDDRAWLDETIKILEAFWKMPRADMADRLDRIAELTAAADRSGHPVERLLSLWEAAARDSLLAPYGQAGILALEPFAGLNEAVSQADAIGFLELIGRVRRWLGANENPRLAIEGLVAYF